MAAKKTATKKTTSSKLANAATKEKSVSELVGALAERTGLGRRRPK